MMHLLTSSDVLHIILWIQLPFTEKLYLLSKLLKWLRFFSLLLQNGFISASYSKNWLHNDSHHWSFKRLRVLLIVWTQLFCISWKGKQTCAVFSMKTNDFHMHFTFKSVKSYKAVNYVHLPGNSSIKQFLLNEAYAYL